MAIFKKKTEAEQEQVPASTPVMKNAGAEAEVLLQPRISEKSVKLSEAGKYVFMVRKNANKIAVKKAVEHAYSVKVVQVNILNVEGKQRNYGRISGKMGNFKKAVVTLKAGDKIEGATETV